MDLKEICTRCGLKEPESFAIEIKTKALFADSFLAKEIIENDRRLGKTTRFMMLGIHNLFKEKNTIIWTNNFGKIRDNHHTFLKYSNFFPELKIEVDNNGQFIANFSSKLPTLRFVSVQDNNSQRLFFGHNYDVVYDDSY